MSERHVIFGTAGHVDHGKSALVLALTGTDPDRLAEEKAREMTIDLGFAFLPLPGLDHPAAIVDVPGHEMFVRNMVAGATGIDAAILVVAADEGVMPQTVEHLDVLRYLGVGGGVVALTKSDKAPPERIAEVAAQVRQLLRGTPLEGAPITPVSALTGEGLEDLRQELAHAAAQAQTRSAAGAFRLPIDRVFSLRGVGTVVTGTVISGALRSGEQVECLPAGRRLRVRGLQVRSQPVPAVSAGQRAALNLADVGKEDLQRGDVLVEPGSMAPSSVVDVRLALAGHALRPLGQRTRVRVHHGTREVMARVVLLEGEALRPGESALAQLRLEGALAAAAGDRFVVRSYSPMQVIGGGRIIDAHPPRRRRAAGADQVAEREGLPPQEAILDALDRAGFAGAARQSLGVLLGMAEEALTEALAEMAAQGRALSGRGGLWFSAGAMRDMEAEIAAGLAALHAAEPLRTFAALNALAPRLVGASRERRECFRLAMESLAAQGRIAVHGQRVRLAEHAPQWTARLATARDRVLALCGEAGLAVPSPRELAAAAGVSEEEMRRVLEALEDAGDLHPLAPDIHVTPQALESARRAVRDYLRRQGAIGIAQCRDLLGASRKYLVPFLEHLDREGLTMRRGDVRVLRPPHDRAGQAPPPPSDEKPAAA